MPNAKQYIEQDRDYIRRRGDILGADAGERATNQSQVAENYRGFGDASYFPLLDGQGGYTPEEIERMTREGEWNDLQLRPEEIEQSYLNGDEQSRIKGNPWDRAKFYNPDFSTSIQEESQRAQRGAVGDLQGRLDTSYDPTRLRISDEYAGGVDENLGRTELNVRGAVDPSKVRQDAAYGDRVRLTPEQQQDIITSSGVAAGGRYNAAADEADRAARASGVTDPRGLVALRANLMRQGAGEAGDARLEARIAASREAAAREQDIERGRRAGEVDAAELGRSTELALGDRSLDARGRVEGLRMTGEQDVANRNFNAANVGGQARVANEVAINNQQRLTDQANQERGTQIATGIEADEAARARDVALNRQNASIYNSGQRYTRGVTRTAALGQSGQLAADKRRADQAEARQYVVGQGAQANATSQADLGRQAQLYGTEGSLLQGTVNAQANQDNQPKLWEKIAGLGIGAVGALTGAGILGGGKADGGVITEPTYALLGEEGPEAVIPLDGGMPRAPKQKGPTQSMADGGVVTQPTKALLGESGPEAVVPLAKPAGPAAPRHPWDTRPQAPAAPAATPPQSTIKPIAAQPAQANTIIGSAGTPARQEPSRGVAPVIAPQTAPPQATPPAAQAHPWLSAMYNGGAPVRAAGQPAAPTSPIAPPQGAPVGIPQSGLDRLASTGVNPGGGRGYDGQPLTQGTPNPPSQTSPEGYAPIRDIDRPDTSSLQSAFGRLTAPPNFGGGRGYDGNPLPTSAAAPPPATPGGLGISQAAFDKVNPGSFGPPPSNRLSAPTQEAGYPSWLSEEVLNAPRFDAPEQPYDAASSRAPLQDTVVNDSPVAEDRGYFSESPWGRRAPQQRPMRGRKPLDSAIYNPQPMVA